MSLYINMPGKFENIYILSIKLPGSCFSCQITVWLNWFRNVSLVKRHQEISFPLLSNRLNKLGPLPTFYCSGVLDFRSSWILSWQTICVHMVIFWTTYSEDFEVVCTIMCSFFTEWCNSVKLHLKIHVCMENYKLQYHANYKHRCQQHSLNLYSVRINILHK